MSMVYGLLIKKDCIPGSKKNPLMFYVCKKSKHNQNKYHPIFETRQDTMSFGVQQKEKAKAEWQLTRKKNQ
jgi:hypothetical protein